MAKSILFTIAALILARIGIAWLLPIMRDEAYYTLWAQHLALGYLDHPPLVAFTTLGTLLAQSSPIAARLGTLLLALGSLLLFIRICRMSGLRDNKTLLVAILLGHGSFAAVAGGVLATPDAALAFAWTLAIHEAICALNGDGRRWLSAGFAVGLGLLAKYHMVLMFGVFLWTLWHHQRPMLRTKWPWLGVLVALLVFAPNIYWNASNSWITMKFQLAHGFGLDRSSLVSGSLPAAIGDQDGSIEDLLAKSFANSDTSALKKEEKKKRRPKPMIERVFNRVSDFTSGQLALWGFLLLPIGFSLYQWKHKTKEKLSGAIAAPLKAAINAPILGLLMSATFIPLLFFGIIGLGSKIQANWAAMYLVSASVLLGVICRNAWRSSIVAVSINIAIIAISALHARTALFSGIGEDDRLMNEAAGYPELAEVVAKSHLPLFVDTFQNKSVLNFLAPEISISQWPGITRPSEFTRSQAYYPPNIREQISAGFRLLTDQEVPPRIPGYFPTNLVELRHCQATGLESVSLEKLKDRNVTCKEPRRIWRQIDYVPYPGVPL